MLTIMHSQPIHYVSMTRYDAKHPIQTRLNIQDM